MRGVDLEDAIPMSQKIQGLQLLSMVISYLRIGATFYVLLLE